jgi:bifunctional non-homologous end joining protein LigD
MAKKEYPFDIDGRTITLSNLEKPLYPSGFTKGEAIDYYIRVSELLLPHFKNRPVTLKRFPNGTAGKAFYEKNAPRFTPPWVQTFPVPRRSKEGDINYILINDRATLVWCANIASLELHPFLHSAPKIDSPTAVVFDLDPGKGTNLLTCAQVAFLLKDVLKRLKLTCFAKVSGSKGLQIYVPLNTPVTYRATQPFAKTIAEYLEHEHPELIVSKMAKDLRPGKIFIDWSQNADHKTTVGVYSLRTKRRKPYVSLPVRWEELQQATASGNEPSLCFEPKAALQRLADVGDLFAPVDALKQRLPADVMAVMQSSGTTKSPRKARPQSQRKITVTD